ncbi:hypothetical protein H5410_001506 [Solanum commersonii]|uniref:Uncharacterized protein n=1 Tax=Solanum commersonii TaxID=4109 RepID=A0A9J6AYY3_SOLCO|nr:hypothetical protein H5410_001506 [Solanum commersonii]
MLHFRISTQTFGIKVTNVHSNFFILHDLFIFDITEFSPIHQCAFHVCTVLEEIGFYGHPMAYLAPVLMDNLSYINKMTIVTSIDESVILIHVNCWTILYNL